MKAVEFEGTITPNGQIAISAGIAGQLPAGELLHVVLQWNTGANEDDVWRTQGRRRFEAAYAPEDAIYDQLMHEAQPRRGRPPADGVSSDREFEDTPGE